MAPSLATTTGRSGGLSNLKATQASATSDSAFEDARASTLTAANRNFQLSSLTSNASGILPAAANDIYPPNVVALRPLNSGLAPHMSADFTNPDLDLNRIDYSQNRMEEGYDKWLANYFQQKQAYVDDWEDPEAANDDFLLGEAALVDAENVARHPPHHRPRIRYRTREERSGREKKKRRPKKKRLKKKRNQVNIRTKESRPPKRMVQGMEWLLKEA